MSITIIESIGFSATHSISDKLRLNSKNHVSHGTKTFKNHTKISEKAVVKETEIEDKFK